MLFSGRFDYFPSRVKSLARMISSCCEKLVDLIIPRRKPPPKHLSADIIAEILSNSPAEFVHQCRRVSKEWNSIISSSYFNNTYLIKRASTPPRILVHQWSKHKMLLYFIDEWGDDMKPRTPRFIKKLCTSDILIAGLKQNALLSFSYNGLLVFRSSPPRVRQYAAAILNPITQEKITLRNSCSGEICGVFLHPIAREYRVLWLKPKENLIKFKMLTLGPKSYWRDLDDFSYFPINNSPPVNVNGALHWISKLHYAIRDDQFPPCGIAIFSILEENFSLRAHPGDTSKCRTNWESQQLLNLEGCLSLTQFSDQKVLEIWKLEDYTNWVWTKRYNIKTDLDFLGIERIPALQPLGIQNGALVFHIITKGLLDYHLQTKTTKAFMFRRLKDEESTVACLYTESLVSFRDIHPVYFFVPCDCDLTRISHTYTPF